MPNPGDHGLNRAGGAIAVAQFGGKSNGIDDHAFPALSRIQRAFRDATRGPGWMVLLALIPYLGGLIVLIFMCLEGTRGANRCGPDPRDPYNVNVFG